MLQRPARPKQGSSVAPPDAAIIERSARDPEAFAILYDRHAAALHRYVARRLGTGVADDIVADTFLAAFRKRDRFDPSASSDARPGLYGIAANLIGKHTRSEVRMLRAYARTGADPVLNRETTFDDALRRESFAAAQRDLAQILATLGKGDREVLLLIAWADWPAPSQPRQLPGDRLALVERWHRSPGAERPPPRTARDPLAAERRPYRVHRHHPG
jgi:RNA polymerase sigma factor (sigma-70 family)